MDQEMAARPTGLSGCRAWLIVAVAAAALMASALAAASASAETTWLCRPGATNNPCLSSEEATVELGNGSSFIEHAQPAHNPPVDCFYVYPTVSSQINIENGQLANANLEIDPEETQVAISQASRFSQVCKVFAPIYPQLTIPQINTPGAVTPADIAKAYVGVLSAFEEYLAKYNDGRGIVLIGHSQGSAMLTQLVKEQIDPNPTLRRKLISAILLGGNLIVPEGKTVGGSFQNVPTCQSAVQTGCLVAYSSFLKEPPNPSNFGRPTSVLGPPIETPNAQVACVNPTLLVQNKHAGPALSYYPTQPFPGLLGPFVQVPKASTPWVATPDQYSAQCEKANGASWLQLTPAGPAGDPREPLLETLGPLWGTHLDDVNVAMGNLVATVGLQSGAYLLTH
jgi:Protein of unknown function (DUF3089)